jgi:hypothetical protein
MDEQYRCTYCGFESDIEKEHVIPAVWFGYRSFNSTKQWIVPACKQCNSYSGTNVFFSIPEKAKFLAKKYRSKASKILKTAFWTDEELENMGKIFRVNIEESVKNKQLILRRINYLDEVSELNLNYKRPEWVEKRMLEMKKEYERIKKQLRKREKNWIQKKNTKAVKENTL